MTKMKIGQKTKLRILKAGVKCWPKITLEAVAEEAGIKSHQAVMYHFPNGSLFDGIASYAVEIGHSQIIVQLIASGHWTIQNMSMKDRARHFKAL